MTLLTTSPTKISAFSLQNDSRKTNDPGLKWQSEMLT